MAAKNYLNGENQKKNGNDLAKVAMMFVSLHRGHDESAVGCRRPSKRKTHTLLRVLMYLIEDVKYDGRVIHQPMVGPLHQLDRTPLRAHGMF